MKKVLFALALGAILVAPAMAQVKDVEQVGVRVGPSNFAPLGSTSDCDDTATVSDLQVTLQVTHTWVGDLGISLAHDGTSASIVDRPGQPASTFGCSVDDVDVVLSDGGSGSVEDACNAGVPAISGNLTPSPDALSAFNGQSLSGDWTLTILDNAGGDTGSLTGWCVAEGAGGTCCNSNNVAIPDNLTGEATDTITVGGGTGTTTGGGTGTPATSTWGVMLLIALFMGVSLFFLRKRGELGA